MSKTTEGMDKRARKSIKDVSEDEGYSGKKKSWKGGMATRASRRWDIADIPFDKPIDGSGS